MVLSILGLMLMFAVVIGIHEYGHYWAMRRCGVFVEEFTIGFGPTLVERQLKSGTMFRIKLVWLGGYAKARAEGENSMESTTRWQKAFIFVNGMVANVLLAMVIMIPKHLIQGTCLGILGPYVGFAPGWVSSVVSGIVEPLFYWLGTPIIIGSMVLDPAAFLQNISGPVGIVKLGSAAVSQPTFWESVFGWFKFTGLISAAIAGFNLIPIAPLDGGHIVGLVIDRFLGQKVLQVFQVVGLVLFLGLVIMAFAADGALLILGGIVFGLLAGWLYRYLQRKKQENQEK